MTIGSGDAAAGPSLGAARRSSPRYRGSARRSAGAVATSACASDIRRLFDAVVACGVPRYVHQSFATVYRDGGGDSSDRTGDGPAGSTFFTYDEPIRYSDYVDGLADLP